MFGDRRILAFVPARGGSKGIKGKNIVDVLGKPLIAYTIEAAKGSAYIDDIIVSTDSEEIKKTAIMYGAEVPFLRPAELATDGAATIQAVLYTIDKLRQMDKEYDVLILLQPTSPLRTAEDIDGAVEKYFASGERGVASVSLAEDSPILIRQINDKGLLEKLIPQNSTIRRQDMPAFYKVNGSIYINKTADINESTSFNDNEVPYIIENSHSADVDECVDLEIVKYWLNRK